MSGEKYYASGAGNPRRKILIVMVRTNDTGSYDPKAEYDDGLDSQTGACRAGMTLSHVAFGISPSRRRAARNEWSEPQVLVTTTRRSE